MARPPRKRTRLNAHRPAAPAALGWKFWAVLGRDETVVVEIPDRGFARSPIEQSVVRMTITVKVRHINQVPVLAQRRTCSAPPGRRCYSNTKWQFRSSSYGARNRDDHHR